MLLSRGATALRLFKFMRESSIQPVRNSHIWNYRKPFTGTHARVVQLSATGIAGFAWWWILWHLWTEPGHIFGEFEYPDASKWTDEELGIPPK